MGRGRGIFFHDEIAMQMEKGIVKEKEYNEELAQGEPKGEKR